MQANVNKLASQKQQKKILSIVLTTINVVKIYIKRFVFKPKIFVHKYCRYTLIIIVYLSAARVKSPSRILALLQQKVADPWLLRMDSVYRTIYIYI